MRGSSAMALTLALTSGAACAQAIEPPPTQIRFQDVTATHLPSIPDQGLASMDAEAVDLDKDGDLDLVVPQEWRANRILINDGQAIFTARLEPFPKAMADELIRPDSAPDWLLKDTEDVSILDLNGDGILDIIMVVEDDQKFGRVNVHQYFRGRADGSYERIYGELTDTISNAVAHGDVDADGDTDLFVSGAGQDVLLLNDGEGSFTDVTQGQLPSEDMIAQDAEFFDVDQDGDLDLVLGLEGGHGLWINDGKGIFADETADRLPAIDNVEARKVTPVDIDGDGDLDLYFAHVSWRGLDGQDRVYINDGTGVFSDATEARLGTEAQLTLDAKFGDLDRDGDVDLVLGNAGSIEIYENDGSGRFINVTQEVLGEDNNPAGINITLELADFNADGKLDLFVGQLAFGGAPPAKDHLFLGM
ncbi:MAG: VCBS repeat-containing protein [Pseudomonadota bacterium]